MNILMVKCLGYSNIVKLAVRNGAVINSNINNNYTALMLAANQGNQIIPKF